MWPRLIHFIGDDDTAHFGVPDIKEADDLLKLLGDGDLFARSYAGSNIFDLSSTAGPRYHVKILLSLLNSSDVPLIRGIAINYKAPGKSL